MRNLQILQSTETSFRQESIAGFGLISAYTISTQVHAINALSVSKHKNLLRVLNHGWLHNSSFYFFDMQFCVEGLYHAIRKGDIHFSHLIRSGVKKVEFF